MRLCCLALALCLTPLYLFAVSELGFTNQFLRITVDAYGGVIDLYCPTNGPNHLAVRKGIVAYNETGMDLLDFPTIVTPLSGFGPNASSVIASPALQVSIVTTASDDTYYDQLYVICNITNVPLEDFMFAQYHDGNIFSTSANDMTGVEPLSRALYQSEMDTYAGVSLYGPGHAPPTHYEGGHPKDVLKKALSNELSNTIVQSNNTAFVIGRRYGTLAPGKCVIARMRHACGSGLRDFADKVSQDNVQLDIDKLKFCVKWNKSGKDKFRFRGNMNVAALGVTNLSDYALTLNIGNLGVANAVTGTVKSSKKRSKAKYSAGPAKVVVKVKNRTGDAKIKGVLKKADIAGDLGLVDDGMPGTLELSILFGLSRYDEVLGSYYSTVDYTAKQGKRTKGTQVVK
jgi:hypothetical protein